MIPSLTPDMLPEQLVALYRRQQLVRGRKPKVPLTLTQKKKRDRARSRRKSK